LNNKLKRTFIAIDIPLEDSIVKQINKLKAEFINEKIKWIKAHQFHITIQFLGNVEDTDISKINESLGKVTAGFGDFSIELEEFGVFKNIKNPRILWIGFRPCDELIKLKNAIEDEMTRFGFEKSDKPFSPHLTIARIKVLRQREKLKELIDSYSGKIIQLVNVGEIILYESMLKPDGPEYNIIKKHSLK
jgi:2'-5' RNA ligase